MLTETEIQLAATTLYCDGYRICSDVDLDGHAAVMVGIKNRGEYTDHEFQAWPLMRGTAADAADSARAAHLVAAACQFLNQGGTVLELRQIAESFDGSPDLHTHTGAALVFTCHTAEGPEFVLGWESHNLFVRVCPDVFSEVLTVEQFADFMADVEATDPGDVVEETSRRRLRYADEDEL